MLLSCHYCNFAVCIFTVINLSTQLFDIVSFCLKLLTEINDANATHAFLLFMITWLLTVIQSKHDISFTMLIPEWTAKGHTVPFIPII